MRRQLPPSRSRSLVLSIFLVLAVVLGAACGDDTSSTDPGAGDGDGTTTLPPPLPQEPIGGPYPIADLTITYEHPDLGTVEYRAVCLGDTATLTGDIEGVQDRSACLALADDSVQQRLIEGPPTDVACTEIYGGPETATITGSIDEQPVDTSVDRADGCGISDWDDLLSDLLPPPRPFE